MEEILADYILIENKQSGYGLSSPFGKFCLPILFDS